LGLVIVCHLWINTMTSALKNKCAAENHLGSSVPFSTKISRPPHNNLLTHSLGNGDIINPVGKAIP